MPLASDKPAKPVKVGQVRGIKVNPLSKEEEAYIESKLPEMYDITKAADFIKPLENRDTKGEPKLKAHKDVNENIIVGWGTRADDLKEGDEITPEDAQARLNKHLKDSIASIKRNGGETAWNEMNEDEKASLLSTFHNVGNSGVIYKKNGDYTEFWKAILTGDKAKAAEENNFGNAGGHVRRRLAEDIKAGRRKVKAD